MKWFLLLLLVPLPVFSLGVDDLISHHAQDMWYLGKGLSSGDSFTYLVCDYYGMGCYTIHLDFYVELESQNDTVWVVQAMITSDHYSGSHVFLVGSDDLEIATDYTGYHYADSVASTVLYLDRFAHTVSPKHLGIGKSWGDVTSSLNIGTDLRVTSYGVTKLQDGTILDVSILEYGFFEKSTFAISSDVPFPVTGLAYDPYQTRPDPPILFSFDLLEYTTSAPSNISE